MRNYQLVLVLRESLKEADRKKIVDLVKSSLKDAKIGKEEDWGQKTLAYEIKHENAGYYVSLNIEAETIPADFEKRLGTNEDILRHLLLRH